MVNVKNKIVIELAYYLAAIALCLLFLFWALQLWRADLTIPFNYGGDTIFFGTLVKGTIDNGWYIINNFIGLPTPFNLYDFPFNCNLEFFIMKMLSLISSNWAWVINSYFLLTFPLTVITSLFTFRVMKAKPIPAIAGSLLFTFVPFHLGRGIGHLNLQVVFLVPLAMLMIFWLYEDNFLINQFRKVTRYNLAPLFHWKNVLSIIFSIAIASTFFYYPFFSCIFLIIAGIAAAIRLKKYTPLFNVLILGGIMSLVVIAYNIPSLLNILEYGRNPEVIIRGPQESEIYGLKIIQLLIPVRGHQLPLFASISDYYAQSSPLVNENQLAALGIIGSIGFMVLLIWVFYRLFNRSTAGSNETVNKLDWLSSINLVAVLLATVGGFGAIFSYLVVPWIRGYNRISIFIAFIAITAIVLLIDQLIRKYSSSNLKRWLMYGCTVVIMLFGIWDQTSTHFVPDYNNIKTEFLNDQKFVREIEITYPNDKIIFQLPSVPFPEFGVLNKWLVYDHFRPYLHSSDMRWSYGTMQGREGDIWRQYVSSKPMKEMLQELALSGFDGIYFDSYGYADEGKQEIAAISSILNQKPLVSANGRYYFFDMASFNQSIKSQYPVAVLEKYKAQLANLSSYEFLDGIFYTEGSKLNITDIPLAGENARYHVDAINGKPVGSPDKIHTINFGKGSMVTLSGWAVDEKSGKPASGVFINIDGKIDLPAFYGTVRPDVADYFKNGEYRNSGFKAYLPTAVLGKGRHVLVLKIVSSDGTGYYRPAQKISIDIK